MNPLPNNMKHYKLYALKPVSGSRGNRISLHKLGEAASVRNVCHPILHVKSGLGVQVFKYWWLYKYSPASASSFTQPVSNLIPS